MSEGCITGEGEEEGHSTVEWCPHCAAVLSADYIREYSSVALLEVSPFPEII